jgi:hypothetical protein
MSRLNASVLGRLQILSDLPAFFAQTSPSFKIDTVCDSVNLDFFMTSPMMPGESIIPCVRDRGSLRTAGK